MPESAGMTAQPLLLKGFEVELFTGRTNGANVGVASDVARDLPGFVTEPDCRNLEYVTDPIRDYAALPEALLAPRRTLRLASTELSDRASAASISKPPRARRMAG